MKVIAGMRYSICGPRFACPRPPALAKRNQYTCEILRSYCPFYEDIVVFSSVTPCTSVNVHQYTKETFWVRLPSGNLRDVKEMISTEGNRESLKGRPFLTFLLSHIRLLVARSQFSLRPFRNYISSASYFATKTETTRSSGNPGPIC
jgi:hypothetical protein